MLLPSFSRESFEKFSNKKAGTITYTFYCSVYIWNSTCVRLFSQISMQLKFRQFQQNIRSGWMCSKNFQVQTLHHPWNLTLNMSGNKHKHRKTFRLPGDCTIRVDKSKTLVNFKEVTVVKIAKKSTENESPVDSNIKSVEFRGEFDAALKPS